MADSRWTWRQTAAMVAYTIIVSHLILLQITVLAVALDRWP